MKLGGVGESSNVVDRRGMGVRGGAVALSGTAVVVALVVGLITGQNPLNLLGMGGGEQRASAPVDPNDAGAVFTRKVLKTTEDTWNEALPKVGKRYQEPQLVLFRGEVQSACGRADASVGPFYCPGDKKAFVDLEFLDQLQDKLGAKGDFAAGYVIAHEIGHHVQNLLGTMDRRGGGKDTGARSTSVRIELQADCYAGVWGAYVKKRGILDPGDVEEALGAAAAIGDDTLQKRAKGRVSPETFSHGTSEQRVRWFKRGMESGDPSACDTFQVASL